MGFLETSKTNAAFKILFGRAHTNNANELANEGTSAYVQLAGTQIIGQEIPADPVTAVNSGIAELVSAVLELDVLSNGKSYRAKYPVGHPKAGQYVSNILPSSFGDDYRPKLYSGGIEIPPLDARNWFLITSAGVLVSESNLSLSTLGTLDCYVYTGKTMQEAIADISEQSGGFTATAGEILVAGNIVYLDTSNPAKAFKAIADVPANCRGNLYAVKTGAATNAEVELYLEGLIPGFVSLTPGAPQYLSALAAGTMTETAPSTTGNVVKRLGFADDAGTSLIMEVKHIATL